MKPSPRVLVLTLHYSPEPTGNAPYSTGLAEGLRERKIPVRVVAAHPHYPEWRFRAGYGQWTRQEKVGGVVVTRLRHYLPTTSQGLRRLMSELSFGIRSVLTRWGRPDVVVLLSPALFSSAVAMVRARLSPGRPRVIVWVQDLYGLGVSETGAGGALVARMVSLVESRMLRAADNVVVIHKRFALHIEQNLGVDPGRMEVIRNWTHLSAGDVPSTTGVRDRHGWASDATVVLHAGNMGGKQGLENVVDAARLAANRSLPLLFVLLGDGNRRAALEDYAGELSTLQFIDPLGDDDFRAAMHSANVLLVNEKAGVSEMSVPSKLTSYFDTGLPVLAASEPGGVTAEELLAADGGVVVQSGRPEALVDAALRLRDDPELAARLGANGKRYRHEVLGREAALSKFVTLVTGADSSSQYNDTLSSRHEGNHG